MPERRDYLPVCNDQGVPLAEFEAIFCVRCVQPECSRSKAGGLFEARVAGWEERLFENPVRMRKDDPLYAGIAAKRFLEIDTGRSLEGGSADWVDPRALEEATPAAKPRPARRATEPPKEPAAPSARTTLVQSGVLNTPFQQGALLDGAPSTRIPVDPWSPPPTVEPSQPTGVPRVKAGARIKF